MPIHEHICISIDILKVTCNSFENLKEIVREALKYK